MPKISRLGGVSNGDTPPESEGGGWPADGGNLSTSSESSNNTSATNSSEFPSPAPTTESPLSKDREALTFVESTDGATPEIGSVRIPRKSQRKTTK